MLLSVWLAGSLFTNNILLHKKSQEDTSGVVVENRVKYLIAVIAQKHKYAEKSEGRQPCK